MSIDIVLSSLHKKEIITLILRNRKRYCLCDGEKKMRKCHPLIYRGIMKIKTAS